MLDARVALKILHPSSKLLTHQFIAHQFIAAIFSNHYHQQQYQHQSENGFCLLLILQILLKSKKSKKIVAFLAAIFKDELVNFNQLLNVL
jgi:hypothetical protein